MPLFTIPYLQIDVAAHYFKTECPSQNDNMCIVMRLFTSTKQYLSHIETSLINQIKSNLVKIENLYRNYFTQVLVTGVEQV
jgi:hypothetical protein